VKKPELIYKGAEANIYVEDGRLVKKRVKKAYRIPELDQDLRRYRTRHEAKIMEKIRAFGFPAPKVYHSSEKDSIIEMEYIPGETLKEVFEKEGGEASGEIARRVGETLNLLHSHNIVHNDLTTSNMLEKDGKIYVIDWGLGYHSTRLEDKAMDLVVLKKSLRATHPKKYELIWESISSGYKIQEDLETRIDTIEKRVRYH